MRASNKDVVQELQEILRHWEDDQTINTNNPTPHLLKLCELFERETINFLKQDPDPFDDRHPVTSKPECALGQILRALFKKDAFVTKLVGHYLRENFFSNLGLTYDTTELNTAACRLLLDLLYGLDTPQVFNDSESTVLRLYSWAEKGPEPLRSYATGLLAAAMDIPDLATSFREQNARLVPIMLKRLWDLKDEGAAAEEEKQKPNDSENPIPERPFAHLNHEYSEAEIVVESEVIVESEDIESEISREDIAKRKNTFDIGSSKRSRLHSPPSKANPSYNDMKETGNGYGADGENSFLNSDCSNSSWAELSSYIVGTYKMYPITKETKEMFILKYLKPVGEYQESLGHVYEHHALELVFHYISVRHTNHACLSMEALRFLGSLLFHKKFCIEFVNMGGIQRFLQIPRPSLPADGVALCIWYLAYCEEAIEGICLLHDNVLNELVRYALWLLECSHQSSRTHAVMFFGMVFKFRALLEKFDEQDGLRRMLNILSTLSIFQENWEQDISDEGNEVLMWHTVKQVCISLKSYFEAHLALRVHQLQRACSASSSSSSCSSLSSFQHSVPAYKAVSVSAEAVEKNVEYLLEHLPYKARWKPVEQFASLNGLELLLQLVATVLNDSFSLNQTETAVSALEILFVCSVMPSVQSAFCDKLTIPGGDDILGPQVGLMELQLYLQAIHQKKEVPGYAILVACIPENLQTISSSPEVQKGALNVLINCLCAPVHRPGSSSPFGVPRNISLTPISSGSSSSKKKISLSEEILRKSWDCVRTSNGIMYLLHLLHKKVPITDADCIRGLACRALLGLARCDTARQIMSKLPVFASGQLQLLMKEPILQDKRIEHVKFQRHAMELTKAVSGRAKTQENDTAPDVSMYSIHKADVVAQTKISYNKHQLLQLISTYLVQEGYEDVGSQLQKEASLPLLPTVNTIGGMGPPSRVNMATPPPHTIRNRLYPSGKHSAAASSSLRSVGSSVEDVDVSVPQPTPIGSSNGGTTPISIKINRQNRKTTLVYGSNAQQSSNPVENVSQFSKTENAVQKFGLTNPCSLGDPGMSLDRIVIEYLTNQHALCKNPVVTCPTFDLFQPHRCPEPKSLRALPTNFTMRYAKQFYQSPSGLNVRSLNRKYIYSRFRSTQVYKPIDDNSLFLTCEFTHDDQNVLVGTSHGEVGICNKYSDSMMMHGTVHRDSVTSLVPHKAGKLFLTSSSFLYVSALWSMGDIFDNKFTLQDCQHAEFSNSHEKILGTSQQTGKLYDITTGQMINSFTPKLSNHYRVNKAALDPSDDLLLTDGVLFDVRSGKQIHKFDKINPILNGIFHRNGLEIISSSEIWDLRTFHLLRTVPILSLCDVSFNHAGDVIFGITVGDSEESQENAFESSFKTVDAADYANIATVDVRRVVSSLAINQNDTQIAIVEKDSGSDIIASSVVRIYDIGMTRQEDDETLDDDDDDDDDDVGNEDESDDSDDDGEQDDDDQDESQNEFGEERNSEQDDDESVLLSLDFSSNSAADGSDEEEEEEEEQADEDEEEEEWTDVEVEEGDGEEDVAEGEGEGEVDVAEGEEDGAEEEGEGEEDGAEGEGEGEGEEDVVWQLE